MAEAGGQSGMVANVVHEASRRGGDAASWLAGREPGDVLEEVRGFARRRPGMFLLGAALAGAVAGRLTRGALARADASGPAAQPNPSPPTATPPAQPPAAGPEQPVAEQYPTPPQPATGHQGYQPRPAPGYPVAPGYEGYPTQPAPGYEPAYPPAGSTGTRRGRRRPRIATPRRWRTRATSGGAAPRAGRCRHERLGLGRRDDEER